MTDEIWIYPFYLNKKHLVDFLYENGIEYRTETVHWCFYAIINKKDFNWLRLTIKGNFYSLMEDDSKKYYYIYERNR